MAGKRYGYKVRLNGKTLEAILFAACETFNKECCGILLGKQHSKTIEVNAAFAYQEIERHPSYVTYDNKKIKKIYEIAKNVGQEDIVGEFHSHINDGTIQLISPSSTDVENMETGRIEIITTIWKKKRFKKLAIRKGIVTGCFGDFFVRVICFMKVGQKRYIRCPLEVKGLEVV